MWPSGTEFSEISIEIHIFLFKKMHLEKSSVKCQGFCLGLSVLIYRHWDNKGDCPNASEATLEKMKQNQVHMSWAFCILTWWRHQMETFSALLALCAGNSPASGEFPAQRPVTRSFDVFFDLCLNKRLRKQSWGWWFETLSLPLWRQCNELGSSTESMLLVMKMILRYDTKYTQRYTIYTHEEDIRRS